MNEQSPKPLGSDDDEDQLSVVERLYAPAPMDAARSRAFDRALEERIAAPVRRAWFRPALAFAGAGALAAALWLALPGGEAGSPTSEPIPEPLAAANTASGWDYELFFPAELGAFEGADSELPGAMQDIAAAFLDG